MPSLFSGGQEGLTVPRAPQEHTWKSWHPSSSAQILRAPPGPATAGQSKNPCSGPRASLREGEGSPEPHRSPFPLSHTWLEALGQEHSAKDGLSSGELR